jgi:hypothetical protein
VVAHSDDHFSRPYWVPDNFYAELGARSIYLFTLLRTASLGGDAIQWKKPVSRKALFLQENCDAGEDKIWILKSLLAIAFGFLQLRMLQ